MGVEVPDFTGDDWARAFAEFAIQHRFLPKYVEIDEQAIVSHRLPNGKVHAEVMHPTLITILEKI